MSVQVRDIEVLRDFRGQLIRFAEELASALQSMQLEARRGIEWIDHDRPQYWAQQTRKAYDQVAATRSALDTCLMRTVAGRHPSCIEEKQAHLRAKRRLEHCGEQKQAVQRWGQKICHDVDEFRARMGGLQRLIDVDLPNAIARLQRSAEILESYADVAPPSTGDS